jgi:hypothetical protein
MFVGYETNSKAYRVLVKGKIVVSKDVRFVEDKLGYPVVLPPATPAAVGVEDLFTDESSNDASDEMLQQVAEAPREFAVIPGVPNRDMREILLRA